jgi:hypothetical protein
MKERKLPIGMLAIVPVVIGMAVYAFTGQAQVEDPDVTATQTGEAAASLTPAATWFPDSPPQWTPEPEPTPEPQPTPQTRHGAFHDGAWVRVNAGAGDCLNARNSPSLQNEWVIINICLPDAYEGLISGYTQEAEGHWWWYLAGLGYVAEDFLTYLREFDLRANVVALDVADHSTAAFLRGADIWLMDADGSDQHLIVDRPDDAQQPQNLTWAPSGSMLSYNTYDWAVSGGEGAIDLHIVSLVGAAATERVYAGVAGGGWSADGVHLGIVREAKPVQMGDGYQGMPAVLDVTTGGQLVLGSEPTYQQKAPAFNHDGSLLMVTYSSINGGAAPAIIIYDAGGTEIQRIGFEGTAWYGSPRWSPAANLIAMHRQDESGARYTVYSVDEARFIAESETPKPSERAGGGCGGGDMWQTEWSRDGRRVLYSFTFGDTGANGIWSWDVATGERRVIVAAGAGSASAGAGTNVMFGASGQHIFIGSSDGGLPRIITDGAQPAWSVSP